MATLETPSFPLTYDLGTHTLTIEDERRITLTSKPSAETFSQEMCLDTDEVYRLLITLFS